MLFQGIASLGFGLGSVAGTVAEFRAQLRSRAARLRQDARVIEDSRRLRVAHYGDPDPNSNGRLWTSLFTGRPVGLLELYSFLPDGAHFVPGKQPLHFDV
jgi:hypothetical protein